MLWATMSADASIRMMFALQLRREPLREVGGHRDGWLQRCSEPGASVASVAHVREERTERSGMGMDECVLGRKMKIKANREGV